jgi:hypothetical protein
MHRVVLLKWLLQARQEYFLSVVPGAPSGPRGARPKDRLRATRDPWGTTATPMHRMGPGSAPLRGWAGMTGIERGRV